MAPVIKELKSDPVQFETIVCSTGQHRQMLDQVLQIFNIVPDLDLQIMTENQSLSFLTAQLFIKLDQVIEAQKPDWVLAQGDTTTVFVASMVAFYRNVRFGHVEAGLRTRDRRRPFPEEINRRLADIMSTAWFAPTERARQVLLEEGVDDSAIMVTGNTVVDALLDISSRPFDWQASNLKTVSLDHRIVLITAHRRESFGEPFRELCLAIRDLSLTFPDVQFIYPVHLNPNVRQPVYELLGNRPNIQLIEPLDYLSLVHLMKHASLILTDSGGIQEEAPTFGVPVLVMRDTTERPEGVEAGCASLVGTSKERIVTHAQEVLKSNHSGMDRKNVVNPYGDGLASKRIKDFILER